MNTDINITPFKFQYYSKLIDMLESQNYPNVSAIQMRTLPKIGYIALLNGQPIAAGFLRKVEPCYAQIDTLVSNKHFGGIIRHEGIKKVVDSLLQDAKSLKLEGIIAHTSDDGVLKRALELGFHTIDQKIIALSLK